ncbi:hypothetical protein SAMN02799626_00506, partial [Caulobacter sp. UNC279MFTsu5.1]
GGCRTSRGIGANQSWDAPTGVMILRALGIALASLAVLSISYGTASARKCVEIGPLAIREGWTAEFRSEFQNANAVYLVRVSEPGPPRGWAMPCDYLRAPPPPLAPGTSSGKALEDYRKKQNAAALLNGSCNPSSSVRFTVSEVIKGPPKRTWVEKSALFDVRNGPPPEPFDVWPAFSLFARHVAVSNDFECGVRARRLSLSASYLVFGWVNPSPSPQDPREFHVSRVYLASSATPFLAEARALGRKRR